MAIVKPVILEGGQLKTAGVGDQVPQAFVQGLDASLSGKAATTDPRLTNAREWTATTISQSEAEAGTASTRRAFTAQRVRQAIVAWFNGISGALGRTILTRTTTAQVRSDIGLGSSATRDVGLGLDELIDNEILPFAVGTANLPRLSPTLNLNFRKVKHLDPRIQFTRGSTATYTDAIGNIRTEAIGEPRFTHDPETGKQMGLLIEEQRTNLLLWSEDFTQSTWSKSRSTITATPENAVVGSKYYKLVVDDGAGNGYLGSPSFNPTGSGSFVCQFFVKKADYDVFRVQCVHFGEESTTSSITFDSTTGQPNSLSGLITAAGSSPLKDGGWMIWAAFSVEQATEVSVRLYLSTGDGVSGVLVSAAQFESGTFPSSYIPTEGAQVTRAADQVSRELGEEFNPSEGTWLLDIQDFRAASNSFLLRLLPDGGDVRCNNGGTGVVVVGALGSLVLYNGEHLARQKIAISYKVGGPVRFYRDGVHVGDSTQDYQPGVVDTVVVSTGNSTRKNLGMCYFPRALSNAELQEITK